jgi:hypothetical protein
MRFFLPVSDPYGCPSTTLIFLIISEVRYHGFYLAIHERRTLEVQTSSITLATQKTVAQMAK